MNDFYCEMQNYFSYRNILKFYSMIIIFTYTNLQTKI